MAATRILCVKEKWFQQCRPANNNLKGRAVKHINAISRLAAIIFAARQPLAVIAVVAEAAPL
jgi:hypothetical protein